MKKLIISIFAVCSLVACEKFNETFLNSAPTTSLTEETIYNTEESLEAHIYGIYLGFCSSSNHMGNIDEFLHVASGLIHWKGDRLASTNWTDQLKFTENANSSNARPFYAEHYVNVNRCNRLLDNLPGSPVNAAYKTEIEAEAKFLRALNYYYLVRIYGDVPLILASPKNVGDAMKARTPFWEVYGQIIDDLTFAEENMRDAARVMAVTGTTACRPHKMAATALKASVYMTIGSLLGSPNDNFWDPAKRTPDFSKWGINSAADAWQLCYNACQKVIDSNLYELAPTYNQLFSWTNPEDFLLKEQVITFASTPQVKYGYMAVLSLPLYPKGTMNYETDNTNYGRWRPDRWVFQKWCEFYGGDKGTGSLNKNIYINCEDPRFDVTYFYGSYINQQHHEEKEIYIYPYNNLIQSVSVHSYPYFKKYLDPTYDVTSGNNLLYVLRYAEIFLIKAEACAELSGGPGDTKWQEAMDAVAQIHKRARDSKEGAEKPFWAPSRFSSKAELIEAIFWERQFEMSGEEHEYFDTHRRGAQWLIDVVAKPKNAFLNLDEQADYYNAAGNEQKGVKSYFYGGKMWDREGDIYPTSIDDVRKGLVCPIPTEEYSYNTAMDPIKDQNDFHW